MKQFNKAWRRWTITTSLAICLACWPAQVSEASDDEAPAKTESESSFWESIKQTGSSWFDKAKDGAADLTNQVKEKAPEIIENVGEKINEAQENISNYRQDQEDQFWDWFEQQTGTQPAKESTTDNPDNSGTATEQSIPSSADTNPPNATKTETIESTEERDEKAETPTEAFAAPTTQPSISTEESRSAADQEMQRELIMAFHSLSVIGVVLIIVVCIFIVILIALNRKHRR